MYEQYKRLIKFISGLIMIATEMILYWFVWVQYYNSHIELPFFRKGNWLMAALYGILICFFSKIYGGFKVGYLRKLDVIYSQVLALICVNCITYIQICLLDRHFVYAMPLVYMFVAQIIIIVVWVLLFNLLYRKLFPAKRMLLVYGERSAFGLKEKLSTREDKYNICGMIDVRKGLEVVYAEIMKYDAAIIGDISSRERNQILKFCFEKSVRAYTLPKISDIIIRGAADIHLFDSPLLLMRNSGFTFEQKLLKRLTDIILSFVGIVITSPLMLLTALAIKLYDGDPVIHKQVRMTMEGKEFCVYKFRSMVRDAEKDGIARLAAEGDVRVTPVGKVIRRTRLDELPQLFNVLKGDMSMVGPRPERPQIAAEYKEYMPEFDYRLKVKGGLTGYAQIYGKYNTTPYDKLKLDLMYIENYSFWLDVKLILMTVKILFMKNSTEGVAEGQTTAALEPSLEMLHWKDDGKEQEGTNASDQNFASK
ncbi:sugar transferase [Hungatella effluvii]|uniref:sugar transferase n=1 Tax=Hungatella effluvii TaxID=1096246 RepID=UPI0022E16211|nr:sugar transferase [Hungatella effluvii]